MMRRLTRSAKAKRVQDSAKWRAMEEQREREREERAAKLPELIERWRNGENCLGYDSHNVPTMLRINGENVETSLGVEFSIEHARRAVRLLGGLLSSGGTYQRNGHTVYLGHYAIDSLDASGTLCAGCHTVKREELERFIRELEALPVA